MNPSTEIEPANITGFVRGKPRKFHVVQTVTGLRELMPVSVNTYVHRINLVIDYIRMNPEGDLSLDSLAKLSSFSPFHFHRLFTTITGEPLGAFVARVRMERAVALMRASPGRALTAIAFDCGFSSLSEFSRSFKRWFGVSPRCWRHMAPPHDGKICQVNNPTEDYVAAEAERGVDAEAPWTSATTIERMPASRIAYIRVADPCAEGALAEGYERLKRWIAVHAPISASGPLIGISHDNPDVTPREKLRYDLCIRIDASTPAVGSASIRTIPACTIARLRSRGDLRAVAHAWDHLYRHWLPASAYDPANLPAMEIYLTSPDELGWEQFDIACCIPLQRRRP